MLSARYRLLSWAIRTICLVLLAFSGPVDIAVAQTGPERPVITRSINLRAVRALKAPVIKFPPETNTIWDQDYLLGNDNPIHYPLRDDGLDVTLVYWLDYVSILDGGLDQTDAFNGIFVFSFDFHTDELGLWEGGMLHWTNGRIDGEDINYKIGSLSYATMLEASDETFLYEFWYGQKFKSLGLDVRVGKIFPFVMQGKGTASTSFANSAFHYPAFIGNDQGGGISTPFLNSMLGVQVIWDISPRFRFIGGGYDGSQEALGPDNRHGLTFEWDEDEGIEFIFELHYKHNKLPSEQGLPGEYKVGLQLHTGKEFADWGERFLGVPDPTLHSGSQAVFFLAEQMLWREEESGPRAWQGLTAFFKTTQVIASEDENLTAANYTAGLWYEGPGERSRDVIGLGVSYTEFSEDVNDALKSVGADELDPEIVFELFYYWEIAPWWAIQPDLQYIVNPAANPNADDAIVLNLSTRVSF